MGVGEWRVGARDAALQKRAAAASGGRGCGEGAAHAARADRAATDDARAREDPASLCDSGLSAGEALTLRCHLDRPPGQRGLRGTASARAAMGASAVPAPPATTSSSPPLPPGACLALSTHALSHTPAFPSDPPISLSPPTCSSLPYLGKRDDPLPPSLSHSRPPSCERPPGRRPGIRRAWARKSVPDPRSAMLRTGDG